MVTIGQHETELLLALGLGSKIAGTAVWFGPLPPELAQAGSGLKRLADNSPGFEAVVAQKPDWFWRSTVGMLGLRVKSLLAINLNNLASKPGFHLLIVRANRSPPLQTATVRA